MEKYFHIDHAMRTCTMATTNLVTKSQRYAKSDDFLEKLITCFHWKRMLLCLEYCDTFADVFMWIWQENGRKTLGQSTAYLATEIQHFVRTFVVWQLFLWQDRSSFCFEDGSLLLMLCTSHKMLLYQSEGSQELLTLLFGPLENLLDHMSGLFSQELAIETAPLDLPHGPSVVVTQLESLIV